MGNGSVGVKAGMGGIFDCRLLIADCWFEESARVFGQISNQLSEI
jgi:hypothetical protein